MRLCDYISLNSIIEIEDTIDKDNAIAMLCKSVSEKYNLEYKYIYENVMKRENKMTTGIGAGLALPHARLDKIDRFYLGALYAKNGIDFESLDGEKVKFVVLLLSPQNMVSEHILLISKISYFLTDEKGKNKLLTATSKEEIYELLKD